MVPTFRSRRSLAGLAVVATGVLAACQETAGGGGGGGGGANLPVATSVVITPNALTLTGFGETQQLTATVRDQDGAAMTGQTIAWATDDSATATVDAAGLVTAVANGVASISATSGTLTAMVDATVAQAPGQVTPSAGDAQLDVVAAVLPDSLVAIVADGQGNVMSGISMIFETTAGGGTVSPDTVVSDAAGRVAAQWTLGTTAGTQSVVARPETGSGSTTFNATANPDVAATLTIVSGDGQSQQNGSVLADPLVVAVTDQYGNPIDSYSLDFDVTSGTGTLTGGGTTHATATDAAGQASTVFTLGPELGAQTVDATAPGLTGSPATFTETALSTQPGSLVLQAGDGQTGLVGFTLNDPLEVVVLDLVGNPFPGATVDFVVISGGGSVAGGSSVSDGGGLATFSDWTIGPGAGVNTLEARIVGTNTITFTATGAVAAFDIVIRHIKTLTASQQAAFDDAEAFWERALYGDVPDQQVTVAAGNCQGVAAFPGIDELVDDIVIYSDLDFIDGPFGIAARAGPCTLRGGTFLPALGIMQFDTTDLSPLEAQGLLDDVIRHEMGHVLGIGTIWTLYDRVVDTTSVGGPELDTHFTGPKAIDAFDRFGGTSYMNAKVPVENAFMTFGTGSLNVHWREGELTTELMTPLLNNAVSNESSILTIASMLDIGYTSANYAAADPFMYPAPPMMAAMFSGGAVRMINDVFDGPMVVIDKMGRTIRVIRGPVR